MLVLGVFSHYRMLIFFYALVEMHMVASLPKQIFMAEEAFLL